jgi:hypothetical protein
MYVVGRFDRTGMLRAEVGFALPANYKIRLDFWGCEYIMVRGREFRAAPYAIAISTYRQKIKMKESENESQEKQPRIAAGEVRT